MKRHFTYQEGAALHGCASCRRAMRLWALAARTEREPERRRVFVRTAIGFRDECLCRVNGGGAR
jgi:hypothetical protein